MRKLLICLLIFSGTISCIFMFNIVLCAMVPEYHSLLSGMVTDDDIPVVTVEQPVVQEEVKLDENVEKKPDSYYKITYIENEDVAADAAPDEAKPAMIDRQYHEDCGTGKGYWVITYEDGTIEIE